jgi:hypothetical protein
MGSQLGKHEAFSLKNSQNEICLSMWERQLEEREA